MTPLLAVTALTRVYGGLAAVDGVELTLAAGERHAVIGPNGAGKTTLLNLIAGTTRPTGGRIHWQGQDITRTGPRHRSALGIARSFQQPAVVDSVSVLDNVALAAWRHGPRRDRVARCRDLLGRFGLADLAGQRAGALPHGARRLLDLAAALACAPRLLLLDEPAAGLTDPDVLRLLAVLGELPAEVAVVLVEHNLDVVTALARTVTVLTTGRVLRTGAQAEVRADPAVAAAYLGEG